jgi:hypothetical protein
MRGVTIHLAALAVALLPTLVSAAPLPESVRGTFTGKPATKQEPACRCQAKGYPNCDCHQGPACRCVILNRYAHLPSKQTCRQNLVWAQAWAVGVLKEARELGYYGPVYADDEDAQACVAIALCGPCLPGAIVVAPTMLGEAWHEGGGWQATQKKEEHQETLQLRRIWQLALALHEEEKEDLEQLEGELRGLVGDAAYCSGNLPGPIPFWRVPRR